MRRFTLMIVSLIMFCGALTLFLPDALADKPYDESSLNGTYYYVFTQVRYEEPPPYTIFHCSGFGTVTFDGDGGAVTNYNDQCESSQTLGELTFDTGEHESSYTVSSLGEVLIISSPDDVTHCQILDRGNMILCDGTTRTSSDHISFIAIGVKQ